MFSFANTFPLLPFSHVASINLIVTKNSTAVSNLGADQVEYEILPEHATLDPVTSQDIRNSHARLIKVEHD